MNNKGGFSWKKLTGLSAAKGSLSRKIKIPFTKCGRQRKAGAGSFFALLFTLFFD
jgi:hypothetical protein